MTFYRTPPRSPSPSPPPKSRAKTSVKSQGLFERLRGMRKAKKPTPFPSSSTAQPSTEHRSVRSDKSFAKPPIGSHNRWAANPLSAGTEATSTLAASSTSAYPEQGFPSAKAGRESLRPSKNDSTAGVEPPGRKMPYDPTGNGSTSRSVGSPSSSPATTMNQYERSANFDLRSRGGPSVKTAETMSGGCRPPDKYSPSAAWSQGASSGVTGGVKVLGGAVRTYGGEITGEFN